jgi:hypothetical protein
VKYVTALDVKYVTALDVKYVTALDVKYVTALDVKYGTKKICFGLNNLTVKGPTTVTRFNSRQSRELENDA